MRFEDKYQPRVFEDLIFEEARVKQQLRYYANNQRHKHLLLFGPPGTAKTTACVVIANARLPEGSECIDVLEASFIASDFEAALSKVEAGFNAQKFLAGVEHPVAVINEVDQLKVEQQQKLRAFVDKCRHGFLYMTTNNLASIDQPLRDRCDCIEVKSLSANSMVSRACEIVSAELGSVDQQSITQLIQTVNGSWRDALLAIEDFVLAQTRRRYVR
jgi:replication-associated recombination protein RarA